MTESEPGFAQRPDYRLSHEPCSKQVKVVFNGLTVADTGRALVVRETRLPPVYYLPREDVRMDLMTPTDYHTYCPFKGNASYWTLTVGDAVAENVVWSYEDPLNDAEPIRGYVAFYRNRMDAWYEEDHEVSIDPVTDVHAHGNPFVDWLMRDAWEASSTEELLARLARQIAAEGIPLMRANLLVRTLHPQVMGAVHVWTRDDDRVEHYELSHEVQEEERFLESPFAHIFEGRGGLRRRLTGADARLDFPILRELAEQGAVDYVALPLTFSDGKIHALTLATDAPSGFDVASLGHIHELLPLLSRLLEVHLLRHTARTLLETYLGRGTGERVLDGLIRRGDGEVIPAVIWWADLRGSTALAERLPRQRYLQVLNRFFESTAGVVIEHGGEVLKFIGDAVMAIFPLREYPDAGSRALDAADEALAFLSRFNAARSDPSEPALEIALALHQGEVNYGNVGVAGRLDFTVTGPAVNEVARLEGLSKTLKRTVVASAEFAKLVPGRLESLGRHELRGVSERQEVFGLPSPS
jgi:adenylate cyclase